MSDLSVAQPSAPSSDGWSAPEGDLLVAPGDVMGVRFRREQIGDAFVALLVELPVGIRPHFRLADVVVDDRPISDPPYSVDRALLHFGQWIEFGQVVSGDVLLAVAAVAGPRHRSRSGRSPHARLRCVTWFRSLDGRLWAEAVGWVGPQALTAFTAWCSR